MYLLIHLYISDFISIVSDSIFTTASGLILKPGQLDVLSAAEDIWLLFWGAFLVQLVRMNWGSPLMWAEISRTVSFCGRFSRISADQSLICRNILDPNWKDLTLMEDVKGWGFLQGSLLQFEQLQVENDKKSEFYLVALIEQRSKHLFIESLLCVKYWCWIDFTLSAASDWWMGSFVLRTLWPWCRRSLRETERSPLSLHWLFCSFVWNDNNIHHHFTPSKDFWTFLFIYLFCVIALA